MWRSFCVHSVAWHSEAGRVDVLLVSPSTRVTQEDKEDGGGVSVVVVVVVVLVHITVQDQVAAVLDNTPYY